MNIVHALIAILLLGDRTLGTSFVRHRHPKDITARALNSTSHNASTSPPRSQQPAHGFTTSPLTRTQVKVIVTVVVIISLIMLTLAFFRFKLMTVRKRRKPMELASIICNYINACRHQERDHLQTDIIRNRAAQFSEPSSRRGSVGYYTQKYTRAPNHRADEPLNIALPSKRSSIPACDHSSRSTAAAIPSASPVRTDDPHHHQPQQHVASSNDTSPTRHPPISSTAPVVVVVVDDLKATSAADRAGGASRCDDQTPLLTPQLTSTTRNATNRTARKYSLNAILPLVRPSSSHPLCSSLTTASTLDAPDSKPRRRVTLATVLRRNSFAKQPRVFCSTVDSTTTTTTKTTSPPTPTLAADSDSSDRTSLLLNHRRKKSASVTPIGATSLSTYQKAFMQKIERFRFIDDSASSTTTVTSPVESLGRADHQPACTRLITNALNEFDDYMHARYRQSTDDEHESANSLIDRLNADLLADGPYSDMNILNPTPSPKPILRAQIFKPVNGTPLPPMTSSSAPVNIPHSSTTLPLSKQRTQTETNGHSRSMDFRAAGPKRDLIRPVALISTIRETSSSSSTTTLTSMRSATSLEFDDNSKPSGVLVDDDFLPMSSPIDEHFWDMTRKPTPHFTSNECFPNVGSSPDVEVRRFDPQLLHTMSETSCDEDDEEDSVSSMNQPEKFSICEFKVKELQRPLVTAKANLLGPRLADEPTHDKSSSTPSMTFAEQLGTGSNSNSTSVDQTTDESLSLKCPTPIHSDFTCSANQPAQIVSEDDDDTQESSANDASEGDDSADNGEIDLVHEFELSQREEQTKTTSTLWTTDDRDIFIMQEDDLLSALITTPTGASRAPPTSIMKLGTAKAPDTADEQTTNALKPKVRFNLDPQYEREREWNKVTKLLGNSVEWTDEFEV